MWTLLLLACAAPETFDVSADDYLTKRPSPDALINEDGLYNGGWYESFDGRINPEDSVGAAGAFKSWLHFSLVNEDCVVSVNLADMGTVGNTAIMVLDGQTGSVDVRSINRTFGENTVEVNADITEARDTVHGDYVRMADGGERIEFNVQADGMAITGSARRLFAEEFVQVSRFHDGYGQAQWYGRMQVEQATVITPTTTLTLGPETLGTYDRMAGHRRTEQAWNWLATVGTAVRASDGAELLIGVEVTTEKEGSRPQVDVKKHGVWIGDTFSKIPTVTFDYEVLGDHGQTTSDWVVESEPGEDDRLDLVFVPQAVRHDNAGYAWFYYSDFHQFIGTVSGTITLDGEVYTIDALPALAEDSSLIL